MSSTCSRREATTSSRSPAPAASTSSPARGWRRRWQAWRRVIDAATGAVARPAGGDRVLHRRGAEPARGRRAGRRAADRRRLDHRDRPLHRRLSTPRRSPTSRRCWPGPIPARILRAAQFHEFVAQLVDWGRQDEVSYVPKMRTQLVAARTVAEALADLATGPDRHSQEPDGPDPGDRRSPRGKPRRDGEPARGPSRRPGPDRRHSNPADPDSALYESGALLPGPHATLAGPTFAEWLDSLREAGVAVGSRAPSAGGRPAARRSCSRQGCPVRVYVRRSGESPLQRRTNMKYLLQIYSGGA